MSEPTSHARAHPGQQPSSSGESTPIVTVDNVSVQLGDVDALSGVTVHVEKGCFLGLIGPNGAGKTTLLRSITDAVTPDTGSVSIDGDAVNDLSSREVSRKVAVVPQDTAMAFDFAVREIVAMGRTPYIDRFSPSQPADMESVERAMKQTHVEGFASRSISEVSGGERQRVLLARAIAQETPVLLLDEPTASLDINHQVQTLELVRRLVEQGKTVIAAIHDLNLAARYCDELVLVEGGRVMASGTPETVLTTTTVKRAFGTPSLVTPDGITGSVHVTPFPDRDRDDADKSVHLLTTDGDGSTLVFRLWAEGHDVTVGPVPPGDAVAVTAEHLGVPVVTMDPWESIDADAIQGVVETADVVLLDDIDIRPGMLGSLSTVQTADRVILLEARPLHERNLAGESGRTLYSSLRERGVVMSHETFLADIRESLAIGDQSARSEGGADDASPE